MDDEGAVFIEGPRLCLVNGVQSKSHPTGDWAIKTQTGYILQGRLDNVVGFSFFVGLAIMLIYQFLISTEVGNGIGI